MSFHGYEQRTFLQQSPVQIAAIELEQIHSPVSKGLSVGLVVSQAARVSGTGCLPDVCIDSQLQPLGVHLKADKGMNEAAGESVPVGGDVAQLEDDPLRHRTDSSFLCQGFCVSIRVASSVKL